MKISDFKIKLILMCYSYWSLTCIVSFIINKISGVIVLYGIIMSLAINLIIFIDDKKEDISKILKEIENEDKII